MNSLKGVAFVLACAPLLLVAQAPSTTIPGVDEPPELSGPGKKFTPPAPVLKEFAAVVDMDKWKESDPVQMKAASERLTEFLGKHPDFGMAYMMRAMTKFCFAGATDYQSISSDLANASRYRTPELKDAYDESSLLA